MKSDGDTAKGFAPFDPGLPYKLGQDPARDALYTTFFLENHLDYFAYPDHVDSPEQVRFMVYTEENERYYPCSDHMFGIIMRRERSPFLQEKYEGVLRRMLDLIDRQIEDEWDKAFLKSLMKTKYQHETRDGLMIPSRLEKRLLKIYIDRTQIQDPYSQEKAARNARAFQALNSTAFQEALNHIDDAVLLSAPTGLNDVKERVDYLKLRRLFALSVDCKLWESDAVLRYRMKDYIGLFGPRLTGDGKFSGPSLYDIILYAKPKTENVTLIFIAADGYEKGWGTRSDTNLFPLSKIKDHREDFLLAVAMNGYPLAIEHGYPARLALASYSGASWVKWLTTIIVAPEDATREEYNPSLSNSSQNSNDKNYDVQLSTITEEKENYKTYFHNIKRKNSTFQLISSILK